MPKRYFKKHLDPSQVALLQEHVTPSDYATDIKLGSYVTHECAIVFWDLVNFTNISWSLSSREVMEITQPFFAHVCGEVHRGGGMIDKYPGDGIVAFFPRHYGEAEPTIVDTALDVVTRVMCWFYDRHRPKYSLPKPSHTLELCAGVDAGTTHIAHVGCGLHSELILMGDQVNCASKCQAIAANKEVVVGQDAVEMLRYRSLYEQFMSTGPSTGITYTSDSRPYRSKRFDWKGMAAKYSWIGC